MEERSIAAKSEVDCRYLLLFAPDREITPIANRVEVPLTRLPVLVPRARPPKESGLAG